MKRYRICGFDFDARANILNQSTEGWSEEAKANFQKQTQQIEQEIINEFGITDKIAKIKRFKEMGAKPLSIIAYHNFLLNQIRSAYIQGGFYPALTGACALGERILNHLILDLRDLYNKGEGKLGEHPCKDCDKLKELKLKGLVKPEFDIFTCKSCSNWDLMINNLIKWEVINSDIKSLFKKLSKKRHKSLHFNTDTINNLENESLESIKLLQEIIQKLFPAFGSSYFIPAKGEAYLKKELESKPFFKKYYIPNSKLVSPFHEVKLVTPNFIIEDTKADEDKEITDEEFIRLREEFLGRKNSKK
ncbi:MAG: hypothetical protein PHH54_02995 [Candidatus Nanoarchaeia archaeon]|nr:hypothetical protein [Candidatus Nanoarchaeia archaeon]MDD5740927.1 hypothetical protein [Candidatus Nanoarchaeia archaeon]